MCFENKVKIVQVYWFPNYFLSGPMEHPLKSCEGLQDGCVCVCRCRWSDDPSVSLSLCLKHRQEVPKGRWRRPWALASDECTKNWADCMLIATGPCFEFQRYWKDLMPSAWSAIFAILSLQLKTAFFVECCTNCQGKVFWWEENQLIRSANCCGLWLGKEDWACPAIWAIAWELHFGVTAVLRVFRCLLFWGMWINMHTTSLGSYPAADPWAVVVRCMKRWSIEVDLVVGTPPQRVSVILDTGSGAGLTCRNCWILRSISALIHVRRDMIHGCTSQVCAYPCANCGHCLFLSESLKRFEDVWTAQTIEVAITLTLRPKP